MGELLGSIGLQDSDFFYNSTEGQQVVYDASERLLQYYNRDVQAVTRLFVSEETELHAERYKLPGNGFLQKRGRNSPFGAVKAGGQWDVAYPLEDFGASLVEDDVTFAYMTVAEYERHLKTVMIQDANQHRDEMLRALFNNTARPFYDEIWPNLTIQPLANGDTVAYPPLIGTVADATSNYYLATNYASASISDTNNPIAAGVAVLQARYGTPTRGSRIVTFYNSAQDLVFKALTDFVKVQYHWTTPSITVPTVKLEGQADDVRSRPEITTPIGVLPGIPEEVQAGTWEITGNCSGSVMCKWAYIPAGYMLQIHLDAAPPLKRRVDPAKVAIPRGLHLWGEDVSMPFRKAKWRDRFGYGVSNRVAAVATQIVASTTYTIPTQWA
jgi:hypothetical protein